MIEEVVPLIVSALVGGLLTLGITKWQQHDQFKQEEKCLLANHYMPSKVEAISKLNTILVDCHLILLHYYPLTKESEADFKVRFRPVLQDFLRARLEADLYLDTNTRVVLERTHEAFIAALVWPSIEDLREVVSRVASGTEYKEIVKSLELSRDKHWSEMWQLYSKAKDSLSTQMATMGLREAVTSRLEATRKSGRGEICCSLSDTV